MQDLSGIPAKISILGCGWLGTALATELLKKGIVVNASVRSDEGVNKLGALGLHPFRISIVPDGIEGNCTEFLNTKILIVSLNPGRVEEDTKQFPEIIAQLSAVIPSIIEKIIFISSTSVYPENGNCMESFDTNPDKPSGQALLIAEKQLSEQFGDKVVIVRFGGLIGYDRVPGRFLAGKKKLKNGNAPVNLIHRDDAVEILIRMIFADSFHGVFNACADRHPLRKDYYKLSAQKSGLTVPEFDSDVLTEYKIVSSEKLKQQLNYSFIYPDPVNCI